MNTDLDSAFLTAKKWRQEGMQLRAILLDCGLREERKWAKPCYTADGKNIAIIQRMNDYLALMFFKGALLADPQGVLRAQGENSRWARRMEFASMNAVASGEPTLRAYVQEAIEVERAGLTLPEPPGLVLVDELRSRLAADTALNAAFTSLTPGRQRGYNLFFSAPKQSATRQNRIDKYVPKILAGKGFHDR